MNSWDRINEQQITNDPQILDNIIQTHFNNINILAKSIQSSNEIITNIQRESTRTNNIADSLFDSVFNDRTNIRPPSRRQRRTNDSTDNSNNDFTYYFTFDTFTPHLVNNTTNLYTSDASLETLLITEGNNHIINQDDTSNNADYHMYEISNFDLIENPINDVCPITRERFDSTTEHILMIRKCKHIFNKSALNIWLEEHNTCPCCRCQIS
jgi:hypothetical protein